MEGRASGRYVRSSTAGEAVNAFVPYPLPPELHFSQSDLHLAEEANRALGRLDGITTVLPDTDLFIYLYIRKEALLSSQIEGTQSSLTDLLQYESKETPGVPLNDVIEVSNYVRAMNHGIERFRGGFPLSLRLIREIHAILLAGGSRGGYLHPGEFRKTQNWIGGTRPGNATFVPPPPDQLASCLYALEAFLHETSVPSLIKAALVHAQFETIHPFLDGNGRLGRLLITLLLCADGVIAHPTLYLSLYFKSHRAEYYRLLQRIRTHGDWEAWIRFFLEGVKSVSGQAVETAREVLALFATHRVLIEEQCGRRASTVLRIHDVLQRRPILSPSHGVERTGLTRPTVLSALEHLSTLGIIQETTGQERGRLYIYTSYVELLSRGTEPLPHA